MRSGWERFHAKTNCGVIINLAFFCESYFNENSMMHNENK